MGAIPEPGPSRPASSGQPALLHGHGHGPDPDGEGEDLPLVVASRIISGADQLERRLSQKQEAVLQRRARLATLRGQLRDQVAVTEGAALEALVTRARLRGAERAILAASSLLHQGVPGDRDQDAGRLRDAARRAAAEAQVRVELLEDPGVLALRRRTDALAVLLDRAAAELDVLEEQHRAVSEAAVAAAAAAAAEGCAPGRDLQLEQLEARWPQLA
ncbi:Bromodomain and WD repeat-containing protein 1, partial [Frankliniella fusca]